MKPTTILPIIALAASASARNVHVVGDLVAREIDPATMDPTKLSILSVLKTAIPSPTGTETALALPTGTFTPQWYKDLPADVIVLLAQMYPATPTSTSVTSTSVAAVSETSAASSLASSSSSSSSSVEKETASPSASASATIQTSLTKTLETVPTATSASNGTLSIVNGTSTVISTSAVGTGGLSPTSKPSASQPAFSTGAKNTVGTGSWSVAVGLSVAALFCLLA